jgi:hypothetical protein
MKARRILAMAPIMAEAKADDLVLACPTRRE